MYSHVPPSERQKIIDEECDLLRDEQEQSSAMHGGLGNRRARGGKTVHSAFPELFNKSIDSPIAAKYTPSQNKVQKIFVQGEDGKCYHKFIDHNGKVYILPTMCTPKLK